MKYRSPRLSTDCVLPGKLGGTRMARLFGPSDKRCNCQAPGALSSQRAEKLVVRAFAWMRADIGRKCRVTPRVDGSLGSGGFRASISQL